MHSERRHHGLRWNGSRRARLALVGLCLIVGCGSNTSQLPRGTSARETSPTDSNPQALNGQAGELLLAALRDPNTEPVALRELSMAGAAAVPWIARALEERSEGLGTSADVALEAELRGVLAAHGDQAAIDTLRATVPSDPVALSIRIRWLAPDDDRAELFEALRHTSERVRLAALRQFRQGPLDAALRLEIGQLAQRDPVASVRASALEALASQGTTAIEMLAAQLSDSDPLPRSVAMRELARLDCARAHSTLARWLSDAPSRDSLAAVRALVPCGAPLTTHMLVPLRRALASSDVALRSEAATTADVFVWHSIPPWMATPLAHDPVPAVRLALAVALMRTQAETAHATLRDLMRAGTTMVSLQAATILASHGNVDAMTLLLGARDDRDPLLRRVAFVALGRVPDRAAELALGLRDSTPSVRLATAGALLRVTHAML